MSSGYRYGVSSEGSHYFDAQPAAGSNRQQIELSLADAGLSLFNYPFLNPEPEAVEKMLKHPNVVLGLGDSGAHCGQIMDASLPTYYLSHWVRDRGEFSLEHVECLAGCSWALLVSVLAF